MLKDNSAAENRYLSLPIFSSGVDLLAITISDLLLRQHIIFKNGTYEVSLNCDIEGRKEHEKMVLKNLKDYDIHLKELVYLSLSSTTNKNYKNMVFQTLKEKGLMRYKFLLSLKGRKEVIRQSSEIRACAKTIDNLEKIALIEMVKTLGGNIYLFNGKTKRKLKDVYPKCVNVREQILKFMGVSGLPDTNGGISYGWGGLGASSGFSSAGSFGGGGGGSFGGGGAGGSW